MLRHGASSEARQLRKNEPHPMGLLAAVRKLFNHLRINLILSVQETNEVKIGH
jgi:hypothetical protein